MVERVYVALGYGMANSIWLSAPEGIIVVDTTESMESAQEVLTVMRTVLQGPIRGVIYTHSHIDHVRGTKVIKTHCVRLLHMPGQGIVMK